MKDKFSIGLHPRKPKPPRGRDERVIATDPNGKILLLHPDEALNMERGTVIKTINRQKVEETMRNHKMAREDAIRYIYGIGD